MPVVHDQRSDQRLSTTTNDARGRKVNETVRSDRRLTAREIAEEFKISVGSYYEILIEKLGMHRLQQNLSLG